MTDPALPIACTLAPAEYATRTAGLAALSARALRSRRPIAGGERLTFTASDDVERDLREAIAAEARCCAFLDMGLQRTHDALVLDIRGPEAAQPVIAELFAARA
jgi:hypothetical protein